ncbi:MAG: hypothetical protein ACR2JF_13765 [Iamia sp.]
MPRRLRPDQIEFGRGAPEPAVAAWAELIEEGTGWMNLMPEVEEEDAAAVTPSPVAAIFRAPGPPIPQVTLMAPTTGRRGDKPAQLGLTHGVGTRVVPRLAAEEIHLPPGWTVVQDHVRRGVVLKLADPVDAAWTVGWALKAAEVLCPIPVTGAWLAEVHRP